MTLSVLHVKIQRFVQHVSLVMPYNREFALRPVSMAMDQALVTIQNVWRVKIQMLLSVLAAAISLNHAKMVTRFK